MNWYRILLVSALVCAGIQSHSQDTLWKTTKGYIVNNRDSASYYDILYRDKSDSQRVKLISKELDGKLWLERNYYPFSPKAVLHGVYKTYSEGQLKDERYFKDGKQDGLHITYWKNGQVRRKDIYEQGKFISGNCYTDSGADTTWFAFEVAASFPNGTDSLHRFLRRNFYYPPEARNERIQGTVIVKFMIDKDGYVTDIVVERSVHPTLDKEAIRIVKKMPQWTPGIQEGRPVKTVFRLPVVFRINDD